MDKRRLLITVAVVAACAGASLAGAALDLEEDRRTLERLGL